MNFVVIAFRCLRIQTNPALHPCNWSISDSIFIFNFILSASVQFLKILQKIFGDNENPEESKTDMEEYREFILSEDGYWFWFSPWQSSPITVVFRNIPMKGLDLFIKFSIFGLSISWKKNLLISLQSNNYIFLLNSCINESLIYTYSKKTVTWQTLSKTQNDWQVLFYQAVLGKGRHTSFSKDKKIQPKFTF